MIVWGVSVSYYTGKLEAYLRYKGIDYKMRSPFAEAKRIREKVGAIQVPIVERDDGRWMSDSTPMILQLEREHAHRPILPADPVVGFITALMEDYADEWLWRAAMHYRWSYEHDRELLSRILTDEIADHLRVPRRWKLRMIRQRQRTSFVVKDGVRPETQAHVEAGYRAALAGMTAMLANRPYLLGNAPSLADFGFMGPMLRHFGQDPTPAEIMRNEGPAVFDWLSRVWNAGQTAPEPEFVSEIPEDASALLQEICETHLVQLAANAEAYAADASKFEMTVQGTPYINLPVSRYRVYCLEKLREAYATLDADARDAVRALLPHPGAAVLWQADEIVRSGYDEAGEAPFNMAINVYGNGVPG